MRVNESKFCVIMIVSINAKPLCDYSFLSFSIHRGAEYQRLLRRKNKISDGGGKDA